MKLQFWLLIIVLAIPLGTAGQSESKYNLNRVHVVLMNGGTVSGKWIGASSDTLIIHGTVQRKEVNFRLKGASRDYEGTIEAVTDTTLLVRLTEQPDTTFVLNRRYVTHLEVTRRRFGPNDNKRRNVSIPAAQIRSIQIHSRGAGAGGFIAGALAGALITGALFTNSNDLNQSETAVVPLLLCPLIGVALATSGKKHPIEGSAEKYKAFVRKVIKHSNF